MQQIVILLQMYDFSYIKLTFVRKMETTRTMEMRVGNNESLMVLTFTKGLQFRHFALKRGKLLDDDEGCNPWCCLRKRACLRDGSMSPKRN